jgi:hypothetical protein
MTRRLLVVSDHLRCLGVRWVVMEATSDHHYLGCSGTPTECRPSQHTVTAAAPHTYTAPNTPPRLDPGSIQTRPTPRTRPRATRAPMPRCPNQRHIRARPPTQIMHRIRRHPPTTPRTRAPGPKVQSTRTNRWDIPRMSTRTSGGPPGVPGLLDHETQIRPRAHKNHSTSGKL